MQRFSIQKSSMLGVALLVLVGCKKDNQGQAYQQQTPQLPVETVKQGNASVENEYAASVEGVSNVEANSSSQSVMIFGLCIVFVFFLLSAQYESYILPFAVLIAIPVGLSGVFVGITFAELSNNIYVQIAMVMLIGLLAKNGILIIEFAIQRRRAEKSLIAAAVEGAKARFRPILRTSLAFIAGLIPLVFVVGPSAMGNLSIGYAAISGMLFGTILGVFVVPVLFVVFQALHEKINGRVITEADWEY